MRRKPAVKDLPNLEGKRQHTQVFVENTGEARDSGQAGIEMIVAMGGITKACREVAPNTSITGTRIGRQWAVFPAGLTHQKT